MKINITCIVITLKYVFPSFIVKVMAVGDFRTLKISRPVGTLMDL
jgi:hypothetical protein